MARHAAIAWLSDAQIPLVQSIAERSSLHIIGAGSPHRGESTAVAKAFDAEPLSDLRAAVASADVDLALIADPGEFGQRAPEDAGAILAARSRNVRIATLEPIPPSALDLASSAWRAQGGADPVDAVRFCGLARLSRPFREAREVLQNFGAIRSLSIAAFCTPDEGSLGARLYSAMELILSLLGEAESVDAAYVAPDFRQGLSALPGETLRSLRGDMNAALRFADGRSAIVTASDHAGRWNRQVTILGAEGRLRIYDDGFEWISADGEKIDQARPADRARGDAYCHSIEALSEAVTRLVDQAIPDDGAPDHGAVLAMTQAALLSARTGQPESPGTIRRLVGAV